MSRHPLIRESRVTAAVAARGRAATAFVVAATLAVSFLAPAPARASTDRGHEWVQATAASVDGRTGAEGRTDAVRVRAERRAEREAELEAAAEQRRAEERRREQRTRERAERERLRDELGDDPFRGVPSGRDGLQACDEFDLRETTTLSEVTAAIGVDEAHGRGVDGSGVDVAVIDTGVVDVSGLQGQVTEGIDLSFDHADDELRGHDLHGHGTAMASLVASRGALGGDGVAPGARVVDVRVGAGDGSVDVSQVIAAIDWVVANRDTDGRNIRVITLAYSTDSDQDYLADPLSRAVEDAWHAGIVVVAAGGNEGEGRKGLPNPASNPYVVAVGAAERKHDGVWHTASWSSKGDGVRDPDVLAPGDRVLGAGVEGSYLATEHPAALCAAAGDVHLRGSGTSQAAAIVAGAAALVLDARPELSPDEVKHLLRESAGLVNGNDYQRGEGLVNVGAALSAPRPGEDAVQTHPRAVGDGSLEESRGTRFVGSEDDELHGEVTAFGTAWDPELRREQVSADQAWRWDAEGLARWLGATWSGATWSGATWSGATWSGATWSGATWSGATWSGATWSGATWSGATWSGATWSGATWSGATWSSRGWTGASWTGASWT